MGLGLGNSSIIYVGEYPINLDLTRDKSASRDIELHNWVDNDLKERFWTRIIDIDIQTAVTWGKIQRMTERVGKPMPVIDSLIAATGITHHLTVVTRNVSDMKASEVVLINPLE